MSIITPIKELKNITEIYDVAHNDLVVMSSELYDKFAKMNRIDHAIYESEQEVANGAEAVDAEIVFAELERKYF